MKISKLELIVASQVYQVTLPYSHHYLLLLSLKEKITINFCLYSFLIPALFLFTEKFPDLSQRTKKKRNWQERSGLLNSESLFVILINKCLFCICTGWEVC